MASLGDVGAHAAACRARISDGHSTIIDTVSMVFPLLSVLPAWEEVTVEVDKNAPLNPREALRLARVDQVRLAREWWGSDRDMLPDDLLVEEWVNTLWRISVTETVAPSRVLESAYDEVVAAFHFFAESFGMTVSPRYKGRNGFKFSADLVPSQWNFFRDGHPPSLGHIAWGGITDKFDQVLAQLHLTGQGCAEVSMADAWGRVHSWAVDHGAWLTRCDVAFDDFEGLNGDVSAWVHRYHDGGFAIRQNPTHQHIQGDSGETLYVGSRDSGKLCRVYAKGCQLGDVESPWVRLEVELRNSQRFIPLAILIDPDAYFAGAYPALESLQVSDVPCPIATVVRNTAAATLKSLIHHAQRSYGKLLDVMASIGYSADEIVDCLRLEGVPSRLSTVSFIGAYQASME